LFTFKSVNRRIPENLADVFAEMQEVQLFNTLFKLLKQPLRDETDATNTGHFVTSPSHSDVQAIEMMDAQVSEQSDLNIQYLVCEQRVCVFCRQLGPLRH
jgi:hypothetical protein